MSETDFFCGGDRRRPHVRASPGTNGIDYAEIEEVGGSLEVHLFLLRSLPAAGAALFGAENIRIIRDSPGTGLVVQGDPDFRRAPDPARDDIAVVRVDGPRDGARYTLRLVDTPDRPLEDIDPRYRSATFSLAAGTPIDVDCLPSPGCPSPRAVTPELSYLAKDYVGFRQLLLDRLATTVPGWRERHSADLYLTVVEALAYEADRLSYAQDAVATEAYIDTARLRTSVRRHARLVDYAMHEGCNARAWVCLQVEADPVVRADSLSFLTRPPRVDADRTVLLPEDLAGEPRAAYEVFEPLLPTGPATVAARDVVDPRALADRLARGEDAVLDYARATLTDEQRDLFRRDDIADEELSTLAAALAERLDDLLRDVGLALRVPGGTERAVRRYGSLNALTGDRLAAHNRAELERLFPEELGGPAELRFHAAHNVMTFYTWDLTECCLPAGATSATLRDAREEGTGARRLRHLRPGDVLVLDEVLGPRSGVAADADPAHRHAVRLTTVQPGWDRLRDVPVVDVAWDRVDALPFPFVLSAVGPPPECAPVEDITVVHGNVVLADHGETVRAPGPVLLREGRRTIPAVPFPAPHEVVPAGLVELCCTGEEAPATGPSRDPAYEPVLERRPLVFAEPLTAAIPATDALRQDPRRAVPALAVFGPVTGRDPGDVVREADGGMVRPTPVRYRRWSPRRDLLSSAPDDRHVVAEIDDDGVAHLRFGSEPGGRPVPGTRMLVWFRTGGGHAGNVGGGALRHVVARELPREGRIVGVSNPLPASGGTDPEPVDEVRLRAPHAFRSRLRRAVAAEDYAAVAQRDFPDEVQRAAATVAVEPVGTGTDARDRTVVTVRVDPLGASSDEPGLRERVWRHLEQYRRIGHMVRVAGPDYVAVDLAVTVRLLPGHQPGAVRGALRDRLGNRALPDGSRGFFHPDAWSFGQGIPLSAVLGAVYGVPGVASARVTRLTPHAGGPDLPADDVLTVRPEQIVRMDDDPDRPENGFLTIGLEAGT